MESKEAAEDDKIRDEIKVVEILVEYKNSKNECVDISSQQAKVSEYRRCQEKSDY